MRTITHGKSAPSFAVMGRANARDHTAGEAILGSNEDRRGRARHQRRQPAHRGRGDLTGLEDAMNHYDVRRENTPSGSAWPSPNASTGHDHARRRALRPAAPASSTTNPAAPSSRAGPPSPPTANCLPRPFSCPQTFDEKDVPGRGTSASTRRPAQSQPARSRPSQGAQPRLARRGFGTPTASSSKNRGHQDPRCLNHLPKANIAAAVDGEEEHLIFGDFTNTLGLRNGSPTPSPRSSFKDLTVQQSGPRL